MLDRIQSPPLAPASAPVRGSWLSCSPSGPCGPRPPWPRLQGISPRGPPPVPLMVPGFQRRLRGFEWWRRRGSGSASRFRTTTSRAAAGAEDAGTSEDDSKEEAGESSSAAPKARQKAPVVSGHRRSPSTSWTRRCRTS